MKARFIFSVLLNALLVSVFANCYLWIKQVPQSIWVLVVAFVLVNLLAGTVLLFMKNPKALICQHGTVLLYAFYGSLGVSVMYQIILAVKTLPGDYMTLLWSLAVFVGVLFVVFWNGILCVYLTSSQLGIKWRVVGLACGLIPVVNLIVLYKILKTTTAECFFEQRKARINKQRKGEALCATKYPILLVHGVFFRDYKFFNYWGRIPRELKINGGQVFYGNHSSAASIAGSAAQLKERMMQVLEQTGAEKVNIIAHSKGGLDCRYAISQLGMEKYVASLTTVNTPHKGCLFADYLLTKIPEDIKNQVAETYNKAMKKMGEPTADFLAAVNDLTDAHCQALNEELSLPAGVYCQSVGSVLPKPSHGKFPMNFSYHLVKYFDGENDGLVSERSFEWGEKYTLLKPTENRGISHGDMIDLTRANISGFDVREFYVNLVNDLKNRGL